MFNEEEIIGMKERGRIGILPASFIYPRFPRASYMRKRKVPATRSKPLGLDTNGTAGLTKIKLGGRARVDTAFTLALAAYNLIRLSELLVVPA